MYSFFLRCIRALGNALLYGTIFSFIIGGTVYAMAGSRMISLAGIEFVDFITQGSGTGSAGVNASALHTERNDSWLPYPGDNVNYIRGTTNFQYGNVSVADSLCLGGTCRNSWQSSVLTCRNVTVVGPAPNYISTATCETDEILMGGGGYCGTPGSFIHYNNPSGQSWTVDCLQRSFAESTSSATAICCK